MKTTLSKRLGLAFAAALGAIGVSLLVPSIAMTAMPNPVPPGINLGGLHLTPTSGSGTDTPSFVADSACPGGTNLANVNTIDLLHVEQTISLNVVGPQSRIPGFGTVFNVDMAAVQLLAGTPGTAESFLFMIDCRTGAAHGTYLDAVQVDFHADGTWQVHDGSTPPTPTPSVSASRSASASPSASHSTSHSASASASGFGGRRVVVGSAIDAHLERPARG
ncbi:hypothetical protein GCM10022255_063590 [Dactylosporangium darangshiense]|uniref:Uncharacterized protein n=3 Tax=Dactylosporangium darangshiense TaxID=579108 RepID=A0ABP8DG86_9ACTN